MFTYQDDGQTQDSCNDNPSIDNTPMHLRKCDAFEIDSTRCLVDCWIPDEQKDYTITFKDGTTASFDSIIHFLLPLLILI